MSFHALKKSLRKIRTLLYDLLTLQLTSSSRECRRLYEQTVSSLQSESENRELYFFFSEVEKHLFSRFCKPGFTHCFLIEKLECIYMMYDPTREGLKIVLPPCESAHPLVQRMMQLDDKLKCVRVITRGDGSSLTYKPKLISCVSTLQYVSGIGYPIWCLTPHQFYKRLVAGQHSNIEKSEVIYVDRER